MTAILEGLVVADFSRVLAGPLATAMLADLGATVIKVERPGTGDDTRHWGPPWTASTSAYFECANRSKQSVELDLDEPADREVAVELARSADIVVENFRVGSLDFKGLGYDAVAARNPGVVYCSISGFGSGGGASLPGYDFLVQAVGGLMSITGDPDCEPAKVGVALVDVLTSKDAVIGILAALHERHTSGRGQHVEVNLLSTLLGSLANQASSFLTTGAVPGRLGNQHPSISPYETLRCADQLIAICCGNDSQFRALVAAIGAPELIGDDRFSGNADRVEHREELRPLLEVNLLAQNAADWAVILNEAGVPAGVVGDISSALDLADRLGLDPRVPVGEGEVDQIRHPIDFSRTPITSYDRPPRLGEHNDQVRAQLSTRKTIWDC